MKAAEETTGLRHDVLNYDDITSVAPFLKGHHKIVNLLMRMFMIDKCNRLHGHIYKLGDGAAVTDGLLRDLEIKLRIDGEEVLDNLPEGPFITVSNHPFGALDGITLINIFGNRRHDFRVMVNLILNHITGLRSSFIAVDALATDDPAKKAVTMHGIKECIRQVRSGSPLGFFPAGAVSKIDRHFRLTDREWQPSVCRLIEQLKVPVIPVFFHGSNSMWFNILGRISWQLRTLRLPAEIFRKYRKTIHVSIGRPISVEEQQRHQSTPDEFGLWLRQQTYSLRDCK